MQSSCRCFSASIVLAVVLSASSTAIATEPVSVRLLGSDLLLVEHGPRVNDAVVAEGGRIVGIAAAKKQRTSPAVFARDHAKAFAGRVAKRLGAKLAPLTWKDDAAVVIAMGDDAWSGTVAETKPMAADNMHEVRALSLSVVGWTADGRYVVLQHDWMGCCGDLVDGANEMIVIDTHHLRLNTYLVELKMYSETILAHVTTVEGRQWLSVREPLCAGCGRPLQWQHWLQHHPLKPSTRATAVGLEAKQGKVSRHEGDKLIWDPPGKLDECPRSLIFTTTTELGKKTARSRTPDLTEVVCQMQFGGVEQASFDPQLSPDGHRLLWLVHGAGYAFGFSSYGMVITSAHRPSVELAVHSGVKSAAPRVRDALGAAGWTVVKQGAATRARENSVIYARTGFETEAKELAKTVPGGASIEALTWSAAADLVLAVGKSASE